jgi:hypothetical protein
VFYQQQPYGVLIVRMLHGRQDVRAQLGGEEEPGFKVWGLALADEGGEVLRERDGLRQLGPCVVSCASWW